MFKNLIILFIATIAQAGMLNNILPVNENLWAVLSSIPPKDTVNVLQVIYTNELGMKNIVYCMAIFETKNEYKLVAPWLGMGQILQKSNITDLQTNAILRDKKDG